MRLQVRLLLRLQPPVLIVSEMTNGDGSRGHTTMVVVFGPVTLCSGIGVDFAVGDVEDGPTGSVIVDEALSPGVGGGGGGEPSCRFRNATSRPIVPFLPFRLVWFRMN